MDVVFCGLLRSGLVIRIGLIPFGTTIHRGGFRPGLVKLQNLWWQPAHHHKHVGYLCGITRGAEQNVQVHLGWVSNKFSDFKVAEAGWNSAINIKTAQRQATGPWPPPTPPLPKKRCESQGGEQWDQSQTLLQPQDSFAEKQNQNLRQPSVVVDAPRLQVLAAFCTSTWKAWVAQTHLWITGRSCYQAARRRSFKQRRARIEGWMSQEVVLKHWICGLEHQRFRSGQARAPMASPFDGAGARRDNKFPNCYPHAAKINNGQRSTLYAPLGSLLQTQGKNCEIPPYLHQRLQKSKNSGGLEHHKSRLIVAITNDFCPLSTPAKFWVANASVPLWLPSHNPFGPTMPR